ncbi:MAG: sigma-70 family RNA polymerase sigma factor [Nannocystaceae bacterium]|nr:sigma-70 family RNA polymerase sigma factor [Nannocystaceae bacterium]
MFSSWPSTQAKLARRAAGGDVAAFRTLYRALHPAVHAYVGRRVAAAAEAEDLVARVFQRMVEHLPRFDPTRASVRGWVLSIARNAVIDHFRTHREHAPFEDDDHVAAPLPLPRDDIDERTAAVRAMIETLPATTREMLSLHFTDELGYREIAAVVGTTEAAVKQRMARALRELRTRLREGDEAKGAERYAT